MTKSIANMNTIRPDQKLVSALKSQISSGQFKPFVYDNWLHLHSTLDASAIFEGGKDRMGSVEIDGHTFNKYMANADDLKKFGKS